MRLTTRRKYLHLPFKYGSDPMSNPSGYYKLKNWPPKSLNVWLDVHTCLYPDGLTGDKLLRFTKDYYETQNRFLAKRKAREANIKTPCKHGRQSTRSLDPSFEEINGIVHCIYSKNACFYQSAKECLKKEKDELYMDANPSPYW